MPSPEAMAKYEMAAKVVMKLVRMWKRRFDCNSQSASARDITEHITTYCWDAVCHGVHGQRRDGHDDEDDPKPRVNKRPANDTDGHQTREYGYQSHPLPDTDAQVALGWSGWGRQSSMMPSWWQRGWEVESEVCL